MSLHHESFHILFNNYVKTFHITPSRSSRVLEDLCDLNHHHQGLGEYVIFQNHLLSPKLLNDRSKSWHLLWIFFLLIKCQEEFVSQNNIGHFERQGKRM